MNFKYLEDAARAARNLGEDVREVLALAKARQQRLQASANPLSLLKTEYDALSTLHHLQSTLSKVEAQAVLQFDGNRDLVPALEVMRLARVDLEAGISSTNQNILEASAKLASAESKEIKQGLLERISSCVLAEHTTAQTYVHAEAERKYETAYVTLHSVNSGDGYVAPQLHIGLQREPGVETARVWLSSEFICPTAIKNRGAVVAEDEVYSLISEMLEQEGFANSVGDAAPVTAEQLLDLVANVNMKEAFTTVSTISASNAAVFYINNDVPRRLRQPLTAVLRDKLAEHLRVPKTRVAASLNRTGVNDRITLRLLGKTLDLDNAELKQLVGVYHD